MGTKSHQQSLFERKIGRMLSIVVVISYAFCWVPSVLYGQQKKPKKLYHDLFSVSFPNEREGWVCGRWGTILHSSDGGKTWEPQQSGTDYTLSSISFIDSKNGWAVGNGGMILNTKDGGKSWVKQKSPVDYYLMGVHFANGQKGWIVSERTSILYTEDGGQTWKVQFKNRDFILKRVSFCDEYNGWAVGEFGFIYHTENGGKTWQRQAGEFKLSEKTGEMEGGNFLFDVVAINPQTAWVVGIDGYVSKTVDGGASWQKITNGITKTHLFGVSSDKQGNILIGGNALLLTSSDGGKTFRKAMVEPPITYGWIYDIIPRSDAGFVAIGKRGWIYLGDKSGASWHRVLY
jgi:photosystem II stability/assembly factor-like uncharacterized protein